MDVAVDVLHNILDALSIGVVVIDEDNHIIVFNRVAGEMNQEDPALRIGKSVGDCHREETMPAVQKRISDLRNRVMERSEAWVNLRGRMLIEYQSPLWDGEGEYVGTLVELHDAQHEAELLKRLGEWRNVHVSVID